MPDAAKSFRPAGWVPSEKRRNRSASREGYDHVWTKLSRAFLAMPQNRWCCSCAARGVQTPATLTGHKVPFKGPGDPLRLQWSNLEPSCVSCNVKKGYGDRKNGMPGAAALARAAAERRGQ